MNKVEKIKEQLESLTNRKVILVKENTLGGKLDHLSDKEVKDFLKYHKDWLKYEKQRDPRDKERFKNRQEQINTYKWELERRLKDKTHKK